MPRWKKREQAAQRLISGPVRMPHMPPCRFNLLIEWHIIIPDDIQQKGPIRISTFHAGMPDVDHLRTTPPPARHCSCRTLAMRRSPA